MAPYYEHSVMEHLYKDTSLIRRHYSCSQLDRIEYKITTDQQLASMELIGYSISNMGLCIDHYVVLNIKIKLGVL